MAETFIRRVDVERITGLKHSTIYERMKAGTFPKPVRLSSRAVVWVESEIAEWQRQRIAERDAEAA